MGDYHSLEVWEKAHELTLLVYQLTGSFPKSELFGLTSQMRRSAASVPANLAEGCGRNSDRELARFGRIALGSANELGYHLLLARDLGLLSDRDYALASGEAARVKRMLASLTKRLTDSR
ncbi:MAG: four helix bundle protein [Gemmatimonadetes bacterium]|nr:four helix bundle protein [Gemmatimonadota bacterium]